MKIWFKVVQDLQGQTSLVTEGAEGATAMVPQVLFRDMVLKIINIAHSQNQRQEVAGTLTS
jgi:hypothetical protein